MYAADYKTGISRPDLRENLIRFIKESVHLQLFVISLDNTLSQTLLKHVLLER